MKYLVPRFILENHADNKLSGQFEAVSLFVDVSGFSTVTNTLKQHGNEAAEVMSDVMDAIFEPLVMAIYEQGGFITTFAGDAFTALFPLTEMEDTLLKHLQALAAASTIQQHIRSNPTHTTPFGAFAFTVKLGIASGSIQWGILSPDETESELKSAFYFNGTAVDDAAGAEHHAQAGNLILTAPVHNVLSDMVNVIEAGTEGHQRVLSITGQLPASQPLPEADVLDQTTFVPDAILNRKTRGEFRQVLSVFVNLMGIDTIQQLDSFVQSVFDLQEKYDGFLARVDFGDKGCNLLMFWGMPTSHENDIVRALNFLLELPTITPGTYKAGVTYQTLFAGVTGSAYRGEYTAYGGGVSLAARLMIKAPWGEIWLDELLTQRAQRYFEIQPVGEFELKGFAEPQPLYSLIELKQQRLEEFFQGEMVGRDEELQQLMDFVQPIFRPEDTDEGRFAGICVVGGGAGLGKSRLIYEFQQRLNTQMAQQGITIEWILGQTNEIVQEPLSPFRYALKNRFNQSPTASDAVNKRNFARQMDEIVALAPPEFSSELNRLRSFIGSLLDLYWENSLYSQVDPEARHEMLFTALKALIQAGSLIHPTIVVTEDIHWMDAETREFAQRMVRNMSGFSIAIIGTARLDEMPEPLDDFPPDVRFHLVHLQDLTDMAMESLAESVLGDKISASVLDLVMRRSEGNPFFAEQILLYLRAQGDIVFNDGMWHLASSAQHSTPLPSDLRAIFIARLDQLTQEVKEVVQAASVLGREFEVRVLAAMLADDKELNNKISAAENETVWTALNQVRYLFKHALLRDAAYSMQLRARRRMLHRVAAETLETIFASEIPSHHQELAYHYEAAYQHGIHELSAKALEYLEKTAQAAADSYQHEIAIDYFSRALEITSALDDDKRYELLMARAEAYHHYNQWDKEAADLDELILIANAGQIPAQQAEVQLKRLRHLVATSSFEEVPGLADLVIQLAQAAQNVTIEANAHLFLAEYYWHPVNLPLFEQHTTRSLDLARVANDLDLEADALFNMFRIRIYQHPDSTKALSYLQDALALYKRTNNKRKQIKTLLRISASSDYREQDKYLDNALEIVRDIGDRQGEAKTLLALSGSARRHNDYEGMFRLANEALRIRQEISDKTGIYATHIDLASLHLGLGDLEEAKYHFEEALGMPDYLTENTRLHFLLIDYYFEVEAFDDAINAAHDGLRIAESGQAPTLRLLATFKVVDVLIETGRLDEAKQYYNQLQVLKSQIIVSNTDSLSKTIADIVQIVSLTYLVAQNELDDDPTISEFVWEQLMSLEREQTHRTLNYPFGFGYKLYRILDAIGDLRAPELLEQLYDDLHYVAGFIPYEDKRRMFLEKYYHRKIIEAYQQLKGISPEPAPHADLTEVATLQQSQLTIEPGSRERALEESHEPAIESPGIMPDRIEDDTGETINVKAGDETPVVIHIESDERPAVTTSVTRENALEVIDDSASSEIRPVIHVQIIIENHGTIHNFNIYNGEPD